MCSLTQTTLSVRNVNMPKIDRQAPPNTTTFPPGSILSNAVPVTHLMEEWVKMCIYGRNRSGKTTLACQFRKPLLLISSEPDSCGGAMSVGNMDGVYLQRISHKLLGQDSTGRWLNADDKRCVIKDSLRGTDKLAAITAELQQAELTSTVYFRTVVLDTATSLQELHLTEIMRWAEPPSIQPNAKAVGKDNYQYRAEKWRRSLIPLLDLRQCNVVILCQEKDHNASTDDFGGKAKLLHTMQSGSFMAPALGSTNAQWLQDECGYIIQIYEDEVTEEVSIPTVTPDGQPAPPMIQRVGTGKRQRHLRLLYHPNFAAGGRWQFDRNTPEFVTAATPFELYLAMAAYITALKV